VFAIAFDLDTKATKRTHPVGVPQAYADIAKTLLRFGFEWKQGSVYTCDNEDIANLLEATIALKTLPWLPESVRDIRAFRVEQWSDLTPFIKRLTPTFGKPGR
jgi:virulence-associated protein VapD